MNNSFEYITSLEYRLKAANSKIAAFESGEKYIQMKAEYEKEICRLLKRIVELEKAIAREHANAVDNRNKWFQVMEDVQKECQKEIARLSKALKDMEKRALQAEKDLDDAKDKITSQRHEIYRLGTELEEEKGKNLKLTAQLHHDYENSSIPSSMTITKKKIPNGREKTGKKPGAQPGYKGHGRKKQVPTATILLPAPQEVIEDPDFRKTKKTIVKQLVKIRMDLDVTEYRADVYYNSKTGERIHAPFPEGVTDDVNYDGSIKAFLFLLNNDCCVSIDKSRRFLSDLTDGKLNISKGMINKLSKEFSKKTKQEQKETFSRILMSPVQHTDCTNAKENGNNAYVFVCATPGGETLYFARRNKGHEGVKGTPVEDYQGVLVHDHEKTFYKYGSNHQECLAHVERYLKDSMENEPERTWSRQMRALVQEMIHYRNELAPDAPCDESKISDFEKRYTEILDIAKEEYDYVPASKYYRDGYNLFLRMREYMENHLLFLHDLRVPTTNNEAERLLRNYKRKQRQAVSFRSFDSIDYLCQCMSMLVMMRKKENINVFDKVSQIFG